MRNLKKITSPFKVQILIFTMLLPSLGQSFCLSDDSTVHTSLHFSLDVSGSVDAQEMRLQMGGIERALRDLEIQDRLLTCGCTEVAVSFWASSPKMVLPPTKIKTIYDLDSLVSFFANESRRSDLQRYVYNLSEKTNVIGALELALDSLSKRESIRKAILISGDGVHSRADQVALDRLSELRTSAQTGVSPVQISAASILVQPGSDFVSTEDSPLIYGSEVERRGTLIFKDVTDFYKKMVITDDGVVKESKTFKNYGETVIESLKHLACTPMS